MNIKIEMSGKVRRLLHACVMSLMWPVFCLNHMLENRPEAFEASGTLLICYGIYAIFKRKEDYKSRLDDLDYLVLVRSINRLEAIRELNEKRIAINFDMRDHDISKAAFASGTNATFSLLRDQASLKSFEKKIKKELEVSSMLDAEKADRDLTAAKEMASQKRRSFHGWNKHLQYVEWAFVITGTLQTGYGGELVKFVHSPKASEITNNIENYFLSITASLT